MNVINTADDLLRLLDENPEFLAAARSKILTDELLNLPAVFAAYAAKSDARFGALERDVSNLKGFAIEARLETKARAKLAFALRFRRTRVLRVTDDSRGSEDFTAALWDALDDGIVSEAEYERILNTDLILKGNRRGAMDEDVYVVLEASYTSNGGDLSRALLSAAILRRVLPDDEVVPALYYGRIHETDRKAAADAGVVAIMDTNPAV